MEKAIVSRELCHKIYGYDSRLRTMINPNYRDPAREIQFDSRFCSMHGAVDLFRIAMEKHEYLKGCGGSIIHRPDRILYMEATSLIQVRYAPPTITRHEIFRCREDGQLYSVPFRGVYDHHYQWIRQLAIRKYGERPIQIVPGDLDSGVLVDGELYELAREHQQVFLDDEEVER